ncbi:MAG: AAA family ATPase [Bacteroidales bacterium]
MDVLFEKFQQRLVWVDTRFVRSLMDEINWNARLIGIKGPRGVGKTTLLLQYIKLHLNNELETSLYASLDNIWFNHHKLSDLVDEFVKKGGKYLFLDEVHRYPDWSQELKNIYDDYPGLHVVFTGSSLLQILNARADLSRRATVYNMQGLSFREYLNLATGSALPVFPTDQILHNHLDLARQITLVVKPLQHFSTYLRSGYYPFFIDLPELYFTRLEEVVNMVLDIELPLLRGLETAYIPKIRQLLQIIAESAPFVPNISKLSERIGINRTTLLSYLFYLNESQLIRTLYKDASGITRLQKPDKLFLDNTNLIYAFSPQSVNTGNLRETFFANQLKYRQMVEYAEQGDFRVAGTHTFEIGGKNKSSRQLPKVGNSWIAADDIEYGHGNKIPLWLFGFLY